MYSLTNVLKNLLGDFLGGPVVKNMPSNAGNTGSVLGWGTKIQKINNNNNSQLSAPQFSSFFYFYFFKFFIF